MNQKIEKDQRIDLLQGNSPVNRIFVEAILTNATVNILPCNMIGEINMDKSKTTFLPIRRALLYASANISPPPYGHRCRIMLEKTTSLGGKPLENPRYDELEELDADSVTDLRKRAPTLRIKVSYGDQTTICSSCLETVHGLENQNQ